MVMLWDKIVFGTAYVMMPIRAPGRSFFRYIYTGETPSGDGGN